jgi:hypothetical protein
MQSMLTSVLSLAALATLAGTSARAETAAGTAADWGLIGAWQSDCAAAPSVAEPRSTFEVRGGALVYERFNGQHADIDAIPGAVIQPDGSIALTIDFAQLGGVREWVLAKPDRSRFHTISNRSVATNVYTVRDGVLLSTRQPAAWNVRCR